MRHIEQTFNKVRENVMEFDSPEEAYDFVSKDCAVYSNCFETNPGFSGGKTWKQALECLRVGDTTYLSKAQKLIDEMTDQNLFSSGQEIFNPDIVGILPCVPHYLMGQPDTMFNYEKTEIASVTTPIKIYLDSVVSAGVTPAAITSRGICLLGLIMALKQVRPIELHCVSVTSSRLLHHRVGGASYKIETNPIDLARSTYMLCDAAFLRVNTFAVLYKTLGLDANIAARDTLPWAFGGYSDGVKYEQNIRRLFSMDDNDVFITGMRLHDHLAQTNPVAWVKRELVKYSEL